MISTDLGRAVAFAWITVVVATEQMTLMILYLSVFAVGVLETIFDTASMSITPSLVQRDQLERANARISGALIAALLLYAAERLFCPDDFVTRGQMAAFLVRALGYTDNGGGDLFIDDDGHTFENDIDKLGTAGVTKGCNPPDNDRFCPDDRVTRGAMAAFLVRALGYTDNGGGNLFIDDDGSTFENDIDRLATAGVAKGCNPPVNDKFCPDDFVTRGQMAAFLHRALG